MGADTRKFALPAPTEPSTLSSIDNDTTPDDLATDVSRRTDKTSYSIPEDGTPVTIPTSKKDSALRAKHASQTSLLIEYFEGGKGEGKVHSRPSVRVRVTPSSHRKSKSTNDHLQITQTNRNTRKPSYTRRISLGGKPRDEVVSHPTELSYSEESNVSSRPPVEIEVLQNTSDLSRSDLSQGRYIPVNSDISSMPPDSMLEGEPVIRSPERRRSRSLEREEVVETKDTLKAPTRGRSRSLSKERITQRVMEKLQGKPVETGDVATRSRETKTTKEELAPSSKSRRRTSKGSHDEFSAISGTESSLLSSNVHRRSGDTHSIRSGVSGTSSINNPKLLATVEDAIKRLILPELNALKEEQQTQRNRSKFESVSRDSTYETVPSTSSRETSRRRVSKSSSAPNVIGSKPKVVLNRDGDDPGIVLSGNSSRKERRSSRGSTSDRSHVDSVSREEERTRRRKSKDKDRHSSRDAATVGLAGAVLTAAALRHHDSRESKEDRKERRRRHSRSSRSRSASVSESVEEKYRHKEEVPPLPDLQSELVGTDLTRDSIQSAETERAESRSSRTETPLREVMRNSPRHVVSPSPRTPTRTPVALQQRSLQMYHSNRSQGDISLSKEKSDRSIRETTASSAALDAAAAAKARALESNEQHVSQYEIADEDQTPVRELSPIQSVASYREETTGSPRHIRSAHSATSVSSAGRKAHRQGSNLSMHSVESSPSTKMARTRKRPQGVSLEKGREILGEPETPRDVDEFFAQNHEQNEMYRRELEDSSQQGSPTVNYKHLTNFTDDSAEGQYLDDKLNIGQDIRGVGANPEYVHTPLAVESAVASLHEPSTVSVRSSQPSPTKHYGMSPVNSAHHEQYGSEERLSSEGETSKERWGAIRNQAQSLAERTYDAQNSPRQSVSRSVDEPVQMGANAFPLQEDMMPEMGYGLDDESEVTTNPSIIKGPLGGGEYDDRNWHAEPTPPMSSRDLLSRQEERERTPSFKGKAAAVGVGAGAAAIAAATAARIQRERNENAAQHHQPSVEDEYEHEELENAYAPPQKTYAGKDITPTRSPALWKDEGYMSAAQPGGITPDYPSHSKLFDNEGLGEFDEGPGADPFTLGNTKHTRHFSGNSHGMSSPLYDAATGKGIDHIQSKDVVALMDHLTVRDAQRNARDTEILVTLVRSAAEMRNSFEEMKAFIRTQDAMIMNTTDKRVDIAEQRIIGGPRPQPLGSPRAPRSSADDIGDIEQKRKNVFKRALKGLSMKGDNDIKNIEKMLMQLLGEVEGLKQAHSLSLQQANRSNSLTSYENLRASGDPGYEPEGRAGTASSPNHSGYLSNPSSRRVDGMHSGYDTHQPHRISTVQEDDEELEDHEARALDADFENTERLLTPTQEVRRNNSLPQETPPQTSRPFAGTQSQENTPKRKHKSNSSSIFGFPKNLSRWSKTTASTNPESAPRHSGSGEQRPYSMASRSGSNIDVTYYDDGQYEVPDDDRLRSTSSLPRDQAGSMRSPSPLIPEDQLQQPAYELDDPKYQAHRNSLNLQHPQPRPGPTHRHQSHLESQAQIFEPVRSPDFDQWGSMPSLARNRLSGGNASGGGNLSPISSDGGYSGHSAAEQAQAPPRPPKIRDDGPLVPQQQQHEQPLAGHGQTRQMYSSSGGLGSQGALMTPLAPIQEVRYSLETDTGHHYSPTPSPRPNQNLAPMASPQRKITGPRPMGSRSPSGQTGAGQQMFDNTGTVRRKPVNNSARSIDLESLESYRSSLDSETF